MLQPVRSKFRKAHKGRIHGNATRASSLNYGEFGLKAIQPERIIGKQIEAARVALTRHMKRTGKVWSRIFPNIPVSKKPQRLEWVKAKDHQNIGRAGLNQAKFYLKLMGCHRQLQQKLLDGLHRSFPLKLR